MILYLNGQDIRQLVLGDLEAGSVEVFSADPGEYLSLVDNFLKSKKVSLDDVKALAAVVGPGSPTALRASLAIVNTLTFVNQRRAISLEKDPGLADDEFIKSLDIAKLLSKGAETLKPLYLHEPKITVSARDNLKRPVSSNNN